MDQDIIRLEGVIKRYGSVAALAGVTLGIREGEFVALLGPSGCGKTTLLRTIAGFVEPSEGEVWIDGHPMVGVPPNKRPVNTVFQHYALFPHYTVAQNVAFGPRRRGVTSGIIPALVNEALTLVGMEGFGERVPSQLSGGQQQRIALARAIINKPKVLLLDEPLGALDLKLRKRMQIELKTLHRKLGITFIYVTHDQEEALVMADRVAVMNGGSIVQFDRGEEIYRTPNSRYVADFIGEANLLPCKVDADGCVRLVGSGTDMPYRAERAHGSQVTLMVRPESIRVGTAPANSPSVSLNLQVRDKIFVGSGTRVLGQTDGNHELMVQSIDRAAIDAVLPGTTVNVYWAVSDGRVLET